jgi:uncharacterized protein (TIGR03437 family)
MRIRFAEFISIFVLTAALGLGQGIITTVAGGAHPCSADDGVQATSACVPPIFGLAVDRQGDFYILTQNSAAIPAEVVRKVNVAGIITTVAGGASDSSGDGGPATKAGFLSFGFPSGLTMDAAGNLYIIDGNAVRMINAATGIITTIAGTVATAGFSGDGGQATKALLAGPSSLALDSVGNLYIGDSTNNRVRKVDTNGTITTLAGNGHAFYEGDGVQATQTGLALVEGVTVDSAGNLYIAERVRIRKVDTSGNITTVAGKASSGETFGFSGDGGLATAALLDLPRGMVFDSAGNLYFGDSSNARIRKIDTTGIITTWAGVPGNISSPLGDGGPAAKAYLGRPDNLGLDAAGNLYVTTGVLNLVRKIAAPPTYVCTNTAAPTITSVDSASAYGGYSYFASGSWLEIKGTNLADPNDPRLANSSQSGQWTSSDFNGPNAPTNLDGISVAINGEPAYVWYLSPTQLNVQAPEDSTTGNVAITVTNCKATSSITMFSRRNLAPGLLAPPNYTSGGTQFLVATFASDGAYVLNTSLGASFGLNSRPAKPGDLIIAYGVGFGDVTPSILPGVIVGQSNALVNPVRFSFGVTPATLSYSGLAGSFVGLYEFYITVPSGLTDGDYQINVTQNGAALPQTMYLTVHN